MKADLLFRNTWSEINLGNIAYNLHQFKKHLKRNTKIMAVVKSNGYGHGAVEVAQVALRAGASSIAVALIEEGMELRMAGITAPILVFGYSDPAHIKVLQNYELTPTIFDYETANAYSKELMKSNKCMNIHLKIDTGMGRLGISASEAVKFAMTVSCMHGINVEGIYTHFSDADNTCRNYTNQQIDSFNNIIKGCYEHGLNNLLYHAANSAAAIAYPTAHYDLVRLGISLYGCYPSKNMIGHKINLNPALSLISRIVFIKNISVGTCISYGCTYEAKEKALIATVPIGYADGYSRRFSNKGYMLIRGKKANVIGRVCMDQLMVDVTNIPGVKLNDPVILYGQQGEQQINVEEAAGEIGTISYELLCAISKRVPRIYTNTA